MSKIPELSGLPEISFIENMTLQETEERILEQYARLYQAETGKVLKLGDADERTLLIRAFALIEYQTMQYIEAKGRGEMLHTSTGPMLDALAALLGITRMEPTRAVATERFTLSEERNEVVAIPAGTRVKSEGGQYFNTTEYAEIEIGDLSVDVPIQAETAGSGSTGLIVGSITVLVDPIPYIASVTNTTPSTGGMETESDDALTERTYLAPGRYSTAGPRDAYEYYVREWRSDVDDVEIISPSPCVVEIYATVSDPVVGKRALNSTEMESLEAYMSDDEIRPMCDKVVCKQPEDVEYQITATYYIASRDRKNAGTIQKKVTAAVAAYQEWQRKLGRDINQTELVARIRTAGAKRVTIAAPVDTVVERTKLPICTAANVAYGGIEDD